MSPDPSEAAILSGRNGPAQFIVDMRANDLVETCVRLKPERNRAAGIETARPTGNNAHDQLVRFPPDACRNFFAGDTLQRRNLFGHSTANAWHGQVDA